MPDNLKVIGGVVVGIALALFVAYLVAGRTWSVSLVDARCLNAQQSYYDALDRSGSEPEHAGAVASAREHADVCAQRLMADAASASFWLLLASLISASLAAIAAWWTVSVMRDTARREMRAYVGIFGGSVFLGNLAEGGFGLRIEVELKNDGQTPGYDLTTWIKPVVIADVNAVPYDDPTPLEERTGTSIISPNTSVHLERIIAVSAEDLAAIRSGEKSVFVWGGADYTDAFGSHRYFIFRSRNATASMMQNPGQGVALSPHKIGYSSN